MFKLSRILLYINTVKYLKGTQILHQIINRLSGNRRKKLLNQVMWLKARHTALINILIPALDFENAYLSRYDIEDLQINKIEILHENHLVNLTQWEAADASHLWNYNLHYLEFLIPLAVACKDDKTGACFHKWCEYVNMWITHPVKDSFEPYTISMRIPNLLICMNILQKELKGTVLEKKLTDSIYQQYRYLLVTQEHALLANHYFENLKTIVICSVFFDEKDNYRKYFVKFCEQIDEQILADGLHYERSVLYHKIILEDILRVYTILNKNEDAKKLLPVIKRMAGALASISNGFTKTPLFNDAGDNVAKDTKCLLKAVQDVTGCNISDNKTAFDRAGYYKLYAGENALLFDCGQIGPSYMGGHAHCDCLSFALSRGGKLLFTNSGTYQYQGKLRQFFRSTKAHNTIMIDEREQAELWGEHRAARRISKIECKLEDQCVTGQFHSYYGDRFRRQINLTENCIDITDFVFAKDQKEHSARQLFHIAPQYRYVCDSKQQFSVWDKTDKLAIIRIPDGSAGTIHRDGEICSYAQDFGRLEKKEVLEIRTPFKKKIKMQVSINLL